MKKYFVNIWEAIYTIAKGMAVTMVHFSPARKSITVQYPDRTPEPVEDTLPECYRGMLDLDPDACTSCSLCAQVCPIDCITIDRIRVEGTKGFVLKQFDIDMAKCMYCGLCTESCPVMGLKHTKRFEGATDRVEDLTLKFVSEKKHKELVEKAMEKARKQEAESVKKNQE